MKREAHVTVLLTFDFEEWEAKRTRPIQANLYEKTKRVTDLLKERDIPATFFLDAQTTLKYPEAAKLLAEKRFELALRSDTHFDTSQSSLRALDFSRQDPRKSMSYPPTFVGPNNEIRGCVMDMASNYSGKVYVHLVREGATSPTKIAQASKLRTSTLMKALIDPKRQENVRPYLSSRESFLECWKEIHQEISEVGETWKAIRTG